MNVDQFQKAWEEHFAPLKPLQKELLPNYNEFRISERMLQDYLDIFRGINSRDYEVEMPYEHPYFKNNGQPLLSETPSVKYILIGESRPRRKSQKIKDCSPILGDENNTYFYDVTHISKTQPWLSAARTCWAAPHFRPCPTNKIKTLLNLAQKGILLLDLFPFAISYTSRIRALLNNTGVTQSFWNNIENHYNLENRIRQINSLLSKDWDLTLVAPCVISEHIVNPNNNYPALDIPTPGLHPNTFRMPLVDETRCASCGVGHEWKKIAVAQQAPSARLLNLSFL